MSAKTTAALIVLLAWLAVAPTMRDHCVAADQTQQNDLESQIDTYFRRLVYRGFSGAALVAKNDEIVLHSGYGLAQDQNGTPVTPDTVFDIGSLSKQFTAAAILHLEMRGLLDVNDPISECLDNVPEDKAAITVHQLLTHSAGLTMDHSEGDLDPITRDEALQAILAQPLAFQPGEAYSYSNSGYTLLAVIIEKVSGRSYQAYLQDNLFEPAGMRETGFYNDPRWKSLNVANGYLNGVDQGSPANWPGPYWGVLGNGGVMSTVGDLHLWWLALQDHAILSQAATEKLFTPHVQEDDEGSFYGYGRTIAQTEFGKVIRHNGGGIGGSSDFAAYTDQGLVVIITSNRIIYRTIFNLPYEVDLVATEAGTQLAKSILSSDFSTLPGHTFSVYPYLAGAFGFIVLVSIIIGFWLRLRGR